MERRGKINWVTSVKLIFLLFTYRLFIVSHTGIIGASLGTGEIHRNERSNSLDFVYTCLEHIGWCVCIHGSDTVNRRAFETSSGCVWFRTLTSLISKFYSQLHSRPEREKKKLAAVNTLALNDGWPCDDFTLNELLQDKNGSCLHVIERVMINSYV